MLAADVWEILQRPISPNSLTHICQEVEAQQEKGVLGAGSILLPFSCRSWKLEAGVLCVEVPFTQSSEHEVDLAEDSLTLNPPYVEEGPAEMWRSANRRHEKLSEG